VFTARYALSPYIKQISFAFKGLISSSIELRLLAMETGYLNWLICPVLISSQGFSKYYTSNIQLVKWPFHGDSYDVIPLFADLFKDYQHVQRLRINLFNSSSSQTVLCHTWNPQWFQVTVWLSIHPAASILPSGDRWRHFNSETGDEIMLYKPERWLDFMGNPRASLDTYLTVLQRYFSLFHETH
jgi:hypothetical protein